MKNLFILLTLLSSNAFSQIEFDEEVLEFQSAISLNNLNCIVPVGNFSNIRTQANTLYFTTYDEIEMKHGSAYVKGCDSDVLEKIAFDALRRFSHAQVSVKVIKGTAKDSRIVFGKCQRNYREQLVLIFDHGLVLTSSPLGKLIPASDC